MNYRITVTIAEHGRDEDVAERLLDVFEEEYPQAGAVVSQNVASGELSMTVAVEAEDPFKAADTTSTMIAVAHVRSIGPDAPPTVLHVDVDLVGDETSVDDRELEPA